MILGRGTGWTTAFPGLQVVGLSFGGAGLPEPAGIYASYPGKILYDGADSKTGYIEIFNQSRSQAQLAAAGWDTSGIPGTCTFSEDSSALSMTLNAAVRDWWNGTYTAAWMSRTIQLTSNMLMYIGIDYTGAASRSYGALRLIPEADNGKWIGMQRASETGGLRQATVGPNNLLLNDFSGSAQGWIGLMVNGQELVGIWSNNSWASEPTDSQWEFQTTNYTLSGAWNTLVCDLQVSAYNPNGVACTVKVNKVVLRYL